MKGPLLVQAAFLLACGQVSPAQDPGADEARRLREELLKARLENLDLRLRLARLSSAPAEELKVLEAALDSEFPEVAAAALRELAALPEDRRRASLPAVLRRLPAAAEPFRVQAVAFLGRVPLPEAEAAILAAAEDPSPSVRRAAAAALKSGTGARAVEALLRLLRDPDRETRIAAIDALGAAKQPAAVAPLTARLATETDEQVLEKAVDVLGVIGAPDAVEGLLGLLDRTPRDAIRWSCINSLGKIGDPRAADRLRPYVEAAYPPDVRQVAVEALGKLKDAAALPRLAEILRNDPNEKLRQAAAAALGLMAPVETIESILLPAYLRAEETEVVRRALWTSMLALAGEGFEANERLARALLERGRLSEASLVCSTRLHPLVPPPGLAARALDWEGAIAAALMAARDPKGALAHFRQMAQQAPERLDVLRRIADCYLELKDLESGLKTLREIDAKLAQGQEEWWKNRRAIVSVLERMGDPEPLLEEAHLLLLTNPPPHPEERRRFLEQALRTGTAKLIAPLGRPEEAARRAAVEAVRRQARRIAPSLAAELEENPKPAPEVWEAAAVILGTPAEGNPPDPKARAAALRAWYEANKPPHTR
jgi:HEAT repeat protein